LQLPPAHTTSARPLIHTTRACICIIIFAIILKILQFLQF
jgi:hypothetical protein